MRNEMNRENAMKSARRAMSSLAGVDNQTMHDVAEMGMRSAGAASEVREDVMDSLFGERSAASEDFRF